MVSATPPNLAVVLLLGGQSSRMGRPKHLLPHPLSGQPLYQHHLDTLAQLQKEGVFPQGVHVSAREEQREGLALPEGVHVVLDDPNKNGDIGPASGILQAFALKPTATWLLLAVDLPFLTRASILHLLHAHPVDSPVSLFLHPSDGNPEPLFSVWTPRALEQLRANCKKGKSGPCRAAKDVWGGKIQEGKGGVKVVEETWVTDADTPEEWEKAVGLLSGETKKPVSLPPTPPLSPIAPPPSACLPQPAFVPKRRKPIPFSEAIDCIHRLHPYPSRSSSTSPTAAPMPSCSASPLLPLADAVGYRSAASVCAIFPHPLHDNSAMDGYAVPSTLLASASSTSPIYLPVLGRIVAGDAPSSPSEVEALGGEGCWEIMTGAVFPSELFDAVVKVEDTSALDELDAQGRKVVRFEAPVRAAQNRRRRGEQVEAGEVVLKKGERVTPEKVLLLTAVGVGEVLVEDEGGAGPARPPTKGRVGIVSTGKEILPLSSLRHGVEPAPGQVIDCVTPYLSALLRSQGYDPVLFSPSGDSSSAFAETVCSALSPADKTERLDLLLTTAGVSLGVTDHLPSTLAALRLTQLFHGVSIRPGAPVMLSVHTDAAAGGRQTPVLSLPGNPMASAVGMRSFGMEVLSVLEGGGGETERGWEPLEMPPQGADEEEREAWVELAGRVREGSSSFFALPLDEAKRRPAIRCRGPGGVRAGPCAVGSLVEGEAWVRIDGGAGGAKTARWCRF
ncbi:hypothetical protein JCM8097_004840 [Rhodosporidiobolus ruineniae]